MEPNDPVPTHRPVSDEPTVPAADTGPVAALAPATSTPSRAAARSRLRVLTAGVAVTGVIATAGVGLHAAVGLDAVSAGSTITGPGGTTGASPAPAITTPTSSRPQAIGAHHRDSGTAPSRPHPGRDPNTRRPAAPDQAYGRAGAVTGHHARPARSGPPALCRRERAGLATGGGRDPLAVTARD